MRNKSQVLLKWGHESRVGESMKTDIHPELQDRAHQSLESDLILKVKTESSDLQKLLSGLRWFFCCLYFWFLHLSMAHIALVKGCWKGVTENPNSNPALSNHNEKN